MGFNLDNPEWIPIELCWHSKAPTYATSIWDFDIYIWRPQLDLPENERVKIFIDRGPDHNWKVLMLWWPTERNSETVLDNYSGLRNGQVNTQFNLPHSNETEIISSLLSIYGLIINDTEAFIDSLIDEIALLVSKRYGL